MSPACEVHGPDKIRVRQDDHYVIDILYALNIAGILATTSP